MPDLLDIIGQDAALAQLQRTLAGNRRPHAYIFAGPEGVGRRTTAVELAKLLLCAEPIERPNRGRLGELPADFPLRQACGRCASCQSVQAGTNGDCQLVYKELARYHPDPGVRDRVMQDLGIDVIKYFLIDPAYRAASGGRGKVFIIREAELMSVAAQNALLKTLEEPPVNVTIILVCTDPGDLLATTRSRCQTVRFAPLPIEQAAGLVAQSGVPAEQARFWAALTGGSIGQSQRLAAERLFEFNQEMVTALAGLIESGMAGMAELLVKCMDKLSKRFQGRDENLAASLANRQAGAILLMLVASVYRDALALAVGSARPLVHADQRAAIAAIAARFTTGQLAQIVSQMATYEQFLWRNVNAKLLWDNVAVTCATAAELPIAL